MRELVAADIAELSQYHKPPMIAKIMGLSEATVKSYLRKLEAKGCGGASQAQG